MQVEAQLSFTIRRCVAGDAKKAENSFWERDLIIFSSEQLGMLNAFANGYFMKDLTINSLFSPAIPNPRSKLQDDKMFGCQVICTVR